MPFCVGCGVRVAAGMERCATCLGRASSRHCTQCGAPAGSATARFCVACGATFVAGTDAAPPRPPDLPSSGQMGSTQSPTAQGVAPGAQPRPVPQSQSAEAVASLIETTRRDRQAIYQRLGRSFLAACYEGQLRAGALSAELGRQTDSSIESIRKGHRKLVDAGICPRCLQAGIAGSPPRCPRCGLVIQAAPTP